MADTSGEGALDGVPPEDEAAGGDRRHGHGNCPPQAGFVLLAIYFLLSSQNATALAAATFRESTPWYMGIFTV